MGVIEPGGKGLACLRLFVGSRLFIPVAWRRKAEKTGDLGNHSDSFIPLLFLLERCPCRSQYWTLIHTGEPVRRSLYILLLQIFLLVQRYRTLGQEDGLLFGVQGG